LSWPNNVYANELGGKNEKKISVNRCCGADHEFYVGIIPLL
jgi:hypothetical protein